MQLNNPVPKVFISYSHDGLIHKQWVYKLAERISRAGIEVILDQYDLHHGDDIMKFMEKSISESDRVLMVCTETYVEKANVGKDGVGYETMVVTGELVNNLGISKFIPVVRQQGDKIILPKSIATRYYINLSEGAKFEEQFEVLIKELHKIPVVPKPQIGKNPFKKTFDKAQKQNYHETIVEDNINQQTKKTKPVIISGSGGIADTISPKCPNCGSLNYSPRAIIQMGVIEVRQCMDGKQTYQYYPPSPYS